MRKTIGKSLGIAAVVFGLLTVLSGGMALFGGRRGAEMAGNAVPFVLWFNFLAGFVYIAAGAAIWRRHRLARPLAIGIALATLLVFAAFWIAVALGVPYEVRTIGAMTLRSAFWVVVATVLMRARQG